MIRGDDMLYQVVDDNGNILYGTNPKKTFKTKEELFNRKVIEKIIRTSIENY